MLFHIAFKFSTWLQYIIVETLTDFRSDMNTSNSDIVTAKFREVLWYGLVWLSETGTWNQTHLLLVWGLFACNDHCRHSLKNSNCHDASFVKSPASRLFGQPFIQAQSKENSKALCYWPLWGESTVRGIRRRPMDSPHKRPVTRKMFPFL